MDELRAQRRLVKSPPELWAEVSDPEALCRHLDLFGEIRISRLEPESTVAWEGDRASGTVVLDSAGWGTRVTLTAAIREPAVPEPTAGGSAPLATDAGNAAGDTAPVAATERAGGPAAVAPGSAPGSAEPPASERAPERAASRPAVRQGFLARLFRRRPAKPLGPHPQPEPESGPPTSPITPPEPPLVATEPELADPGLDAAPAPEPAEARLDAQTALAALEGVLDRLGAAHHRPFSR